MSMMYKKYKIKDLAIVNPSKKAIKDLSPNADVSFIPMDCVSNEGKILKMETKKYKDVSKGFTYFEENDILFAKITPCMENGKGGLATKLTNFVGFGSTEFHVIRANKDIIEPKYLYYIVHSKLFRKQAKSNMTGSAGQKRVPKQFIENYELNVPNKIIQLKVVELLDMMKTLIGRRKEAIAKLDELIQAVFLDMFGDPVTNPNKYLMQPVKEICLDILGGGTPSKSRPEYYVGNIPWVTPKDMKKLLIKDSIDHINSNAIENSSAKLIPKNSLIMVIRSGILKKKLPLAINQREITINQDMKAFVLNNEKVKVEYLLFFFNFYQRVLLSKVRSVTADNIEFNQIKELMVPLPSVMKQQKFVDFFNKVLMQQEKEQHNLNQLEIGFESLLQKVFKGELKVNTEITAW